MEGYNQGKTKSLLSQENSLDRRTIYNIIKRRDISQSQS